MESNGNIGSSRDKVTGVRAWVASSGVLPPYHGGPSIGGDLLEEDQDDVERAYEESSGLENIAANNDVGNVTQLRKKTSEVFKPIQEKQEKVSVVACDNGEKPPKPKSQGFDFEEEPKE
ncbi:hypothetical protein L1049_019382 [Liquidambar formosana]|uniref:Uncharacterized protein n=1 Tax=Liquidambar formosana TaxID=63359 RepID=A0AAP0S5R7_LIQFO